MCLDSLFLKAKTSWLDPAVIDLQLELSVKQ